MNKRNFYIFLGCLGIAFSVISIFYILLLMFGVISPSSFVNGIMLIIIFLSLPLVNGGRLGLTRIVEPKIVKPKNEVDKVIKMICDDNLPIEIYFADVFSGGVIVHFNGLQLRVTNGICYNVEVYRDHSQFIRGMCGSDYWEKFFYDYLEKRYNCFNKNLKSGDKIYP